jgi:hypothetical protein
MSELSILAWPALICLAFIFLVWVTYIKPNPKVVAQMPGGLARYRLAISTLTMALLWPHVGKLLLALLGFVLPNYAIFVVLGLSLISWFALKRWSPLGPLWADLDNAHYEVGRIQRLTAYNSRR